MKNHSNRILTVFFAVSLAISISLFFVRAAAFPFEIYGAIEICAFYFPAVPFLFLQMLLCKAVQKKWVRFLPLLAVAIVAMVAAVGCASQRMGYAWLSHLAIALHRTCSWLHNRFYRRLAMAQTGLCGVCTELCFYGGIPTVGIRRSYFYRLAWQFGCEEYVRYSIQGICSRCI